MTRLGSLLTFVACFGLFPASGIGAEAVLPSVGATKPAASLIDPHLADHWRAAGVAPAPTADDAEFLRRATLDLLGRIPTDDERRAFAAAKSPERRAELLERLLESPEFPLHFARVIDDWIQRDRHGDEAFVDWLRAGLAARRSYDALFTAMLVGPWDAEADKGANRFLAKRAKNLDALTADGSRAFFGVDITCARCHDHPLVDDWKQEHYYGLASFFHRTHATGPKGMEVGEKKEGELSFAAKGSGQRTARPMFLDGTFVAAEEPTTKEPATKEPIAKEPAAKNATTAKPAEVDKSVKSAKVEAVSRRKQLVDVALSERKFLSRAAVNRVWAWFFGRGLVEPVDQMHSGNPASVPKLLDALADDFASHGYDLRRLVEQIITSRAYQATYRGATVANAADSPDLFLAPRLRPLTPRQYALSLVVVLTGDGLGTTRDSARIARYRELEKQAAELCDELDPTVEGYQAGYREALYVANHEKFQKLMGSTSEAPRAESLLAKLAALPNDEARIVATFEALLGRGPTNEELRLIRASQSTIGGESAAAVAARMSDLVWALSTSAEFRFNH